MPAGKWTTKWRCFTISKKDQLINEEIRAKEVRVNGEGGEQLGIMPIERAMQAAAEKNLDLVLIAPQATPPVCKIMDYGKHKFEQSKRDKEARKNQKVVNIKEIRLSLKIDTHDLDTKLKNGIKFLSAGDKLKVSIRFRGRELAHPDQGQKLMKRVAEELAEVGTIDRIPKMEGRSMVMFVTPIPPAQIEKAKKAKAKAEAAAKAADAPAAEKTEQPAQAKPE